MPTYEYRCPDCNYEFEEFQLITAEPIKLCPKCAKKNVQRLIGCGAGVIFKGSGFYETDYRSEGYKKAAKADKEKVSSSKSDSNNDEKKSSSKKETTKSKKSP